MAGLDEEPAGVEERGRELADAEPAKHERIELVPPRNSSTAHKRDMMGNGIPASEVWVVTEDVDKVGAEICSQNEIRPQQSFDFLYEWSISIRESSSGIEKRA